MDVVVLVKQVPDTASNLEIAEDKKTIQLNNIKWVMNPYDEIAVEAALKIKEEKGGTVTILSFGPKRAQEAIRTALAMGADKGVLVEDPDPYRSDPASTASVLVNALGKLSYDLILAGARSVDYDNFQTGSAVAQILDIPQIAQVIELKEENGKIQCCQITEGGSFTRSCALPALVTTQRGLNEPRYPSLPGIMKAKKKPLEVMTLSDIGLRDDTPAMSTIVSFAVPEQKRAAMVIKKDTVKESAAALVDILHNEVKAV